LSTSLAEAIHAFNPVLPLAVAYSGGADSTALLLACAQKWPGQVRAVHIHHGLQAAADDFQRHCEAFCAQLNVPLTVKKVNARHAPGQSPEEAARAARYRAFAEVFESIVPIALVEPAQPAIKNIALAQHADDQVETILLALSRGAGLAGLAAMPARWERDGLHYHRPLLGVGAADIRAWLAGCGADFIEDPTNTDERFTRNRIRARLLPALQAVFPQFRDTFARSASHAAQAQEVLTDVADQDLAALVRADGTPLITRLQALSRPRQANVLRHWLRSAFGTVPSAAQLTELLDQVAACTTRGHQIHIKVGTGFVVRTVDAQARRRGDALTWYNP